MKEIYINLKKGSEIFTISILFSELDIVRKYVTEGYEIIDIF